MAKGDPLDVPLSSSRLSAEEVASLVEIFDEGGRDFSAKLAEGRSRGVSEIEVRRRWLNYEIRHTFGHSLRNLFRDDFEPDYRDILDSAAEELKIERPESLALPNLERTILAKLIGRIQQSIIKTYGHARWLAIESEALSAARTPTRSMWSSRGDRSFSSPAPDIKLIELILQGRKSCFELYKLANTMFFEISKLVGLRIGVAAAGPVIGSTLHFLLGPFGMALAIGWAAFSAGNTNWQKTINPLAVVITARMRLSDR